MIKQAIILAAGFGKRLRPLTEQCPKPMLKISDKCLIDYHVEKLANSGIENIIVHVSYLADEIINYLGDGSKYGLNIIYARSSNLLGTGGGIKFSQQFLIEQHEPYLCINSDIYSDYDYSQLVNYQEYNNLELDGKNLFGHMVLVANPVENLKGDFDISHNIQNNYNTLQKKEPGKLYPYTFSGIAVYHPNLLTLDRNKHPIVHKDYAEYSIIEHINSNEDKIIASVHNGMWYDIGTIERYEYVNNLVRQKDANLG